MHIARVPIGVLADLFTFTGTEADSLGIDSRLAAGYFSKNAYYQEQEEDLHRLHASFTVGTKPGSFRPAHHPQKLIPNVILILAGIKRWGRGRRRGRRAFGLSLFRRNFAGSALRKGYVGLIVHDAPLGCSVAILGLLGLINLGFRSLGFLPRDVAQTSILEVFL